MLATPHIPELRILLKISSLQLQFCHDRIQIDDLPVTLEGVMPVQEDVTPSRRRHLRDQLQRLRVAARLVFRQQFSFQKMSS